jgi:hypothetical protein
MSEATQVKAPSDFTEYPWSSVMKKTECEVVAVNIMKILKRTGNAFRPLSWEEYQEEREKDGNFTIRENRYFNDVIGYCGNAESAATFSKTWRA